MVRDVVNAGPRSWSRSQSCRIDRSMANLADPVRSGRHAFDRSVDLPHVIPRLTGHRRQLGALVCDRLALRVVFVIGIGVPRCRDEGGQVIVQLRGAGTEGSTVLVEPCNRADETGQPIRAGSC